MIFFDGSRDRSINAPKLPCPYAHPDRRQRLETATSCRCGADDGVRSSSASIGRVINNARRITIISRCVVPPSRIPCATIQSRTPRHSARLCLNHRPESDLILRTEKFLREHVDIIRLVRGSRSASEELVSFYVAIEPLSFSNVEFRLSANPLACDTFRKNVRTRPCADHRGGGSWNSPRRFSASADS